MRKCTKCEIIKKEEDFPRTRPGDNWCKKCKYEYNRQWRKKNREKINATEKIWRYKNWDRYLESQRRYYHKNIEERREYGRKAYRKRIKINGYSSSFKSRNGVKILSKMDKCEICGTRDKLQIHHKDNQGRFNVKNGLKPNNKLTNLQVLCISCHSSLHAKLRRKS